jgi:hypothetical protein
MASPTTDVRAQRPVDWFSYLPLLIPVVTVAFIVVLFATWQSPSEAYTEDACDGLRAAVQGIADGDRAAVSDGERAMSALDPAGEDPEANQADLQKLWAASGALARVLKGWDASDQTPTGADLRLITTGVDVCRTHDSPWFAPQRLLRD